MLGLEDHWGESYKTKTSLYMLKNTEVGVRIMVRAGVKGERKHLRTLMGGRVAVRNTTQEKVLMLSGTQTHSTLHALRVLPPPFVPMWLPGIMLIVMTTCML